jgi:hypothetical protein
MSRQRESKIVGTFNNVIFYNHLGQYCMRIKPSDVRRTEASVHSGLNFGKASRIGKQIRNLVRLIYPVQSDSLVMNRLNGAINKFLSWKEKMVAVSNSMPPKLPFIYRFQFNSQSDLSTIRAIEPIVMSTDAGTKEINFAPFIPGQSLQAPSKTASFSLRMMMISVNLHDTETRILGKFEIEIPYTNEMFQMPVTNATVPGQPGDLIMVIVSIEYMVKKNGAVVLLNDKKKQPCGITWASII